MRLARGMVIVLREEGFDGAAYGKAKGTVGRIPIEVDFGV